MPQETRTCQNCQKEFIIEPEDFEFYNKINVPPPTWCPECRMIRRMMFRNERSLYKRKCDAPGHNEEIVSIYSSDKPFKVYDQKYWWSDNWDPMEYGKDYNWNKPFFEQFKELLISIPLPAVINKNQINSEYCNHGLNLKNCYLAFSVFENENVMYSKSTHFSKDSLDNYRVNHGELNYECVECSQNYKVSFCVNSHNCYNSSFLVNCSNCSNCFGCINLKNKSYYIFNKSYSIKEYENFLTKADLGSYNYFQKIRQKMEQISLNYPRKYARILKSIDVIGDFIYNSKSLYYCFESEGNCENVKYALLLKNLKDAYDVIAGGPDAYLLYDSVTAGNYKILFCYIAQESNNLIYSMNCHSCSNLFGCIGLRHKQYCILNKQYTKEEYEKLVSKIIEHMNKMPYIDKKGRVYKYGEFFPPELSPFSYNETIAQEYFPLTKEEALEKGYSWKNPEERNIKPDIYTKDLPDHIKDTKDDIIGKIIQCNHAKIKEDGTLEQNCNEQCTTAFKIIPQELEFYRKMNLPLPRLCPNCRHYQRIKQRNPLKLWKRKCMCGGKTSLNGIYQNTTKHFHGEKPCPNEFYTTYSPERPEIVYCEECYNSEVV